MPVTAATFERLALEDPEGHWELHCGRPREKPAMTFGHNRTINLLATQFHRQIDPDQFFVHVNYGHLPTAETYYIPDLFVVPVNRTIPSDQSDDALEAYAGPALLVVEVWSPSTGGYDVDTKFPAYRARGDLEIWRIHPYQRTLIAWRRQPGGSYDETILTGGTIEPVAIPGVSVDLNSLFRR
jgi:Uma2 family endonuclease